MSIKKISKISIFYTLLCVLFVALDQYTKYMAVRYLQGRDEIPVIKGVLHFNYTQNHGAAFGVFQNQLWFLLPVTILLTVLLLYFIYRVFVTMNYSVNSANHGNTVNTIDIVHSENSVDNKNYPGKFYFLIGCIVLLIAGALGNMIDRIRLGYVVDFIYAQCKNLPVIPFDFPIFNVADCYVTVSCIAIFLIFFLLLKEEEVDMLISFRNLSGKSEKNEE